MSYVYSVVVISQEFNSENKKSLLNALNSYMEEDEQLGCEFEYMATSSAAGKKSYEHDLLVGALNYGNHRLLFEKFNKVKLDQPAIMIITSPEGDSVVHRHGDDPRNKEGRP